MSKPCFDSEVAEILPCAGPDGICYGIQYWEKRVFTHGEKSKYSTMRECPFICQCREWWKRTQKRGKNNE